MYRGRKILCLIPARGGSKGVPGKNVKDLCGKPLIAYSIEQAKASPLIDRVVVDSDDDEILAVGRKYGAETLYKRPPELAGDSSSIFDVLEHAVHWLRKNEAYEFDVLVLLHATTPLRLTADIDACIEKLVEKEADNVFSAAPSYKNPYFNMVELDRDSGVARLSKQGRFLNRQEAPPVYDMNSSIYVWKRESFLRLKTHFTGKTYVHVMPRERSIDIDEPLDFKMAEVLMREKPE